MRIIVAALLVASGTASAVLVGSIAGVALQWTPRADLRLLLVLAMAAVLADVARVRFGRPSPLSVNKQVPVEWGRLFDPRVVAVLYGARLGVGPLTMLSTWLWWAATIGAALTSVLASVVTALVFGLVRLSVTVAASHRADRAGHATWFGRLRTRTTRAWLSVDGFAVVLVVVALVATACTADSSVEAGPATVTTANTESEEQPVNDDNAEPESESESENNTEGDTAAASTPTSELLTESSLAATSLPLVTSPDDIEPRPPVGPAALAAVLLSDIDGFDPVTAAAGDRELSINDAAVLQPDPTEELPLLETRGYQGGWTRAFLNADNDVLVTTVYDFVSALEAEFYLEDGTITLIGDGGTIYEVESIPGARGFRQDVTGEDGPLVVYGITFTRSNQWFLVTIVGDEATATPERLLPIAAAQYDAAN